MLSSVTAERFLKVMGNGRTRPCLIECITPEGVSVEVVVKSSAGCMEKEKNLGLEAIAAMLAADLSLPVPEPFVVELADDFIESLTDHDFKTYLSSGCRLAFGSKHLGPGYAVWLSGQTIPDEMSQDAIEVYIFDAIIVNTDRRPENPNCLTSGSDFAIFDHELTLHTYLFWKEPWKEDSDFPGQDVHIFAGPYFTALPNDLSRFISAWESIPDSRFDNYLDALPYEWRAEHEDFFKEKLSYLKNAKQNIRQIVENAMRRMR